MKILATGKDKFTYNRTQVLLSGLESLPGVEVTYYPIKDRKSFNRQEFTELSKESNIVYIPPFRHSDVKFIKKLSKAPVVFDALISKYLTRTVDHGKWWTAWEKSWRDRAAFHHCDLLVMDTQAHKDYVVNRYGLELDKVIVVPVGVNTELFKPVEREAEEHDKFVVGFYGGMIPLQGVDKIVECAGLLSKDQSIEFQLIGKGPRFKQVQEQAGKLNLNNLKFLGWVPYEELNDKINAFDICLGVFGDSLKADVVVPNKVFHYSALKKCTITKDTIGIKEVFQGDDNIVLTENKPEAIADAILKGKEDRSFRMSIAENAYDLITSDYSHQKVAELFVERVSSALSR
ncbi:glycosyltransferase [Marinoscillum sp. MHG1-6]|uniref:glycosyltransferase n=1 Tax=Marinoscillum sp. MHG1-6 TaxID=2959627 RepID=UPI00215802E6|nr:glycosyltransferase [Marinoscillum sp. MHG1-6]